MQQTEIVQRICACIIGAGANILNHVELIIRKKELNLECLAPCGHAHAHMLYVDTRMVYTYRENPMLQKHRLPRA